MRRLLFILAAAYLCLQQGRGQASLGSIATPILGMAVENSPTALRPVWGIPGAAILGQRIKFTYPIANAVASASQGFALTVSARDQAIRLEPLFSSSVMPVLFTDAMTAPDLLVLSPLGRAAAIYKQSLGQLQVISGLPQNPIVASVALPVTVAGAVAHVAVSDDGSNILASTSASDGFALWRFTSNQATATLLIAAGIAAFAFRPNSHDAITVTEEGDVMLVGDVQAQPQHYHLPGSSPPTGIQLSSNGKSVYVSHASGVAVLDLGTQAWTETACPCAVHGLFPFDSANIFRVTDANGGPLFFFDASNPTQTRLWFVPQEPASAAPHRSVHE